MVTTGVDDLERSLDFYANGLAWAADQGIVGREFEHGAAALFELDGGTEFSIGHNVRSEQEVDAVMHQAERAGPTVVKLAQTTL